MLENNFRSGRPLAGLPARWLNEVAQILNHLRVELTDDAFPSIDKPPMPSAISPWTIRIPKINSSGVASGIPEGTEIPGDIGIARIDGEVWLVQSFRRWNSASGQFEAVTKENAAHPPAKILRLDNWLRFLRSTLADSSATPESGEDQYLLSLPARWEGVSDDAFAPTNTLAPEADDNAAEETQARLMVWQLLPIASWDGVTLSSRLQYVPKPTGAKSSIASLTPFTFTARLSYSSPEDEMDQGSLNAHPATITVLATEGAQEGAAETILKTEVEEANEASTYAPAE